MFSFRLSSLAVFVWGEALTACSGKVSLGGVPPGATDGGPGPTESSTAAASSSAAPSSSAASSPSSSGSSTASGPTCLLVASSYDPSCARDLDCVLVELGDYCDSSQCLVPGAIGSAALTRFAADVATTPIGSGAIPAPQCSSPAYSDPSACCVAGTCQFLGEGCASTPPDAVDASVADGAPDDAVPANAVASDGAGDVTSPAPWGPNCGAACVRQGAASGPTTILAQLAGSWALCNGLLDLVGPLTGGFPDDTRGIEFDRTGEDFLLVAYLLVAGDDSGDLVRGVGPAYEYEVTVNEPIMGGGTDSLLNFSNANTLVAYVPIYFPATAGCAAGLAFTSVTSGFPQNESDFLLVAPATADGGFAPDN